LLKQGQIKRIDEPPQATTWPDHGGQGLQQPSDPAALSSQGIRHTIPHKRNEQRTGPFDRTGYRMRNVVERLINRASSIAALLPRYEKLAESYRTLWVIAMTMLWIR